MSALCKIDDKLVPLYRIVWVSSLPHFCGGEDCHREGQYEVHLDSNESLWAVSTDERDEVLASIERWQAGLA